jgi:hypothetical protein
MAGTARVAIERRPESPVARAAGQIDGFHFVELRQSTLKCRELPRHRQALDRIAWVVWEARVRIGRQRETRARARIEACQTGGKISFAVIILGYNSGRHETDGKNQQR